MATIHVINNVKIRLYSRDHNPPHIHAVYAEYEVKLEIMSGEIIVGHLPKTQLKEVSGWLENPVVKEKLVKAFHRLNPHLRRKK